MTQTQHQAATRQGRITVPGAELQYRLSGPAVAEHTVVFENGWSGSFPYAYWLEQALSPHLRVLLYDRAGIGGSHSSAPLSCAGLTAQLAALLAALDIATPVVLVGHSYGGLVSALHTVQSPRLVRCMVQIDPTSELDDPVIDKTLRVVPAFARFLQLRALLGLAGALEQQAGADLPLEALQQLRRPRREQLRSLEWSIAEMRLLPEMRRTIAAGGHARACPRLIISADATLRAESGIGRYLVSDTQAVRHQQAFQALHRRQAALSDTGRWLALPYDHLGLITRRDAATAVASTLLGFLSPGRGELSDGQLPAERQRAIE